MTLTSVIVPAGIKSLDSKTGHTVITVLITRLEAPCALAHLISTVIVGS